jgi:hypothetical protein
MPTIKSPTNVPSVTSPRSPTFVDGAEQQRRALLAAVSDLDPSKSPRAKTLSGVPSNVVRSNRASELTIRSATRGEPVNGREIPVKTSLTLTAPDFAGDAVIKGKLTLPPGVRLLEGDAANIVFKRSVDANGLPSYTATLAFAVEPGSQGGGWSATKPSDFGVTLQSYPPGSENRAASASPQGALTWPSVPLTP